MEITLFNGCKDVEPTNLELTFDEISAAVCEIWSQEPWDRSRKGERQAVIFGRCEGARSNANIRFLSCLAADIDTSPDDSRYIAFDDMCDQLESDGLAYIAHTTTSSSVHHNKFRLIFPYPIKVPPHLCRLAWHKANERFGMRFDKSTHDPARLSFLPAAWNGGYVDQPFLATRHCVNGGYVLSADEIAALDYYDTKDVAIATRVGAKNNFDMAPPKLRPHEIGELSKGRGPDWNGWKYISDIHTSPLVTRFAKHDLIRDEGSRDYRFLKGCVRQAILNDYPVNHAALVRLAQQYSTQFLKRDVPHDLAAQAHNAMAFGYHNYKIPAAGAADNPSRPVGGT